MVCKYCNYTKNKPIDMSVFKSVVYEIILCSKCWNILDDIKIPDYIPYKQWKKFQLKTHEASKM